MQLQLIMERRVSKGCSVVLRYDASSSHPWITHLRNDEGEYYWGNYFRARSDAEDDFYQRVRKWATGEFRQGLDEGEFQ